MALSSAGVQVFQSRSVRKDTIARTVINGVTIRIFDSVETDVVEYHGMDEDSAKNLAHSLNSDGRSDYSVHGLPPQGSTVWPWWISCPNADGIRVTASCRRNGNSRMFTVTKVTETHECSCSDSTAVEY